MTILISSVLLSGSIVLLALFKARALGIDAPLAQHEYEEQMYALSRVQAAEPQRVHALFKTQV